MWLSAPGEASGKGVGKGVGKADRLADVAGEASGLAGGRIAVVLLDVADLEQAAQPGVHEGLIAGQPAELDPHPGGRRTRPGAFEELEGGP